jgi:hypothetical protein
MVPGTRHRITTDARVVHCPRGAPRAGMGLCFDRLPSLDASILTSALDRRRASSPS